MRSHTQSRPQSRIMRTTPQADTPSFAPLLLLLLLLLLLSNSCCRHLLFSPGPILVTASSLVSRIRILTFTGEARTTAAMEWLDPAGQQCNWHISHVYNLAHLSPSRLPLLGMRYVRWRVYVCAKGTEPICLLLQM